MRVGFCCGVFFCWVCFFSVVIWFVSGGLGGFCRGICSWLLYYLFVFFVLCARWGKFCWLDVCIWFFLWVFCVLSYLLCSLQGVVVVLLLFIFFFSFGLFLLGCRY